MMTHGVSRIPAGLSGEKRKAFECSAALADAMASWNPGKEPVCCMDITAAGADRMVATSSKLKEMADIEPALAGGVMWRDRQHWIGDGSSVPAVPDKKLCVTPALRPNGTGGVPAFWSALYTSTAMNSGYSMWRALMSCPDSGAFRRLPWRTWRLVLDDGVRVAEINDASSWIELVCSYGVINDGIMFPDWVKLADIFDAVHFAWPLVVAAQGLDWTVDRYVVARSFWDVECALWLKWGFKSAQLVEEFNESQP